MATKSTTAATAAETKTEQVKLLKPHTHAGERLEADAIVTVSPADADWLVKHKVGERVDTTTA